jgi:hypothetical protein
VLQLFYIQEPKESIKNIGNLAIIDEEVGERRATKKVARIRKV